MTRLSPLVFFGTEKFSAKILKALLQSRFEVEAVITKPDTARGRGQQKKPTDVKKLALKSGIKVFEITNKEGLRQAVRKTSCQTGVLASFGKIIPEDVITAFRNGIINVHPSLLPLHRGPAPIESTILNGDKETGVSIMLLANEVDVGDVYAQTSLALTGRERASELYSKLADMGADVLMTTLSNIETGALATAQNHQKATFSKMVTKADGVLNPELHSATELERRIRAYDIWPKSRLDYMGKDIIVLSAQAGTQPTSKISVSCKDGSYLNIETVLSPNGKPTTAQQFVNNFLTK